MAKPRLSSKRLQATGTLKRLANFFILCSSDFLTPLMMGFWSMGRVLEVRETSWQGGPNTPTAVGGQGDPHQSPQGSSPPEIHALCSPLLLSVGWTHDLTTNAQITAAVMPLLGLSDKERSACILDVLPLSPSLSLSPSPTPSLSAHQLPCEDTRAAYRRPVGEEPR